MKLPIALSIVALAIGTMSGAFGQTQSGSGGPSAGGAALPVRTIDAECAELSDRLRGVHQTATATVLQLVSA